MSEKNARAEIQFLIEEEDAAWSAGDAVKFSARVTPDAVFTNIMGQQFVGRDEFEKQHARIFASIYAGSKLKQVIAHLRFLSDDIAIVDTHAEMSGAKVFPPGYASVDGILRARLLQVLVRQAGEWGVASYHNVVFNPAPRP